MAAQLCPQLLGSTDDQRLELADGGHPSGGRAAPGAQQRSHCLPLPAAARDGRAVLAKRLASGPDGVQRVTLGPTATGGPLGSAHLDDPLTTLLQHRCQAGAEAARSLDRPQATANNVTVMPAFDLDRRPRPAWSEADAVVSGVTAGGARSSVAEQWRRGRCGGHGA